MKKIKAWAIIETVNPHEIPIPNIPFEHNGRTHQPWAIFGTRAEAIIARNVSIEAIGRRGLKIIPVFVSYDA